MLSKNNNKLKLQKAAQKDHIFTIRKLTTGVASVMLGTLFVFNNANTAKADTTSKTNDTSNVENVKSNLETTTNFKKINVVTDKTAINEVTNDKNNTIQKATAAPTSETSSVESKADTNAQNTVTKKNLAASNQQTTKIVDNTANSDNVTLTHGVNNNPRTVTVSVAANAGDTITVKVPLIFQATTDQSTQGFYNVTSSESSVAPGYTTNKKAYDTTFTYTINETASITFNIKLTPTVSDWSFLPDGAIYNLTLTKNGQDEGKIQYKIAKPAEITAVKPNFDQNQLSNGSLVKNQNYEVGINLPNDGIKDGDNFAGTITVDVPDGFILSQAPYVGQGIVSDSTQAGDTDSQFNDLTQRLGITYSQANAGAPVIISFNNAKQLLNSGNLLFWGQYTKDLNAADNNFKAIVSYYSTDAAGEKALNGTMNISSQVMNVNLPVNDAAKDSLLTKFVNNTGDIYTDNGTADGEHQEDNQQFNYGEGRSIQVYNNGNVTQTNVDVQVDIEPGTVFNGGNSHYALHITTPSINQTKSVVLTLTNGKEVVLTNNLVTSAFNNNGIINISDDAIAQGVAKDGSNIKKLDVIFNNIEPGTKAVISFANNAILSKATTEHAGDTAHYSMNVTSAQGVNQSADMNLPIGDPTSSQNVYTGVVENFTNGSYQPTSTTGGNQGTIGYDFRNLQAVNAPSKYLVAIPQGFDINDVSQLHLYQNGKLYSDGTIKDLGYVGLNNEHMFEVTLGTTPSYQVPIYLLGNDNKPINITVNSDELPASYSYPTGTGNNQMSLIMAIDDDNYASSQAGSVETITLKNGQSYKVITSPTGFYPGFKEVSYDFTYPSMYGAINGVKSDTQSKYNSTYIPSKPNANITALNYSDNNNVDNTTGSIRLSNVITDGTSSKYSYNLVNLPNIAAGDSATLQLTAAGTLDNPDNTDSQILYSLSPVSSVTNSSDMSNWLTASQIKDWSKVRAVLLESKTLTSGNVVSATLPFKVINMSKTDTASLNLNTNFDGDHQGTEYSAKNVYKVDITRYVNVVTNWVKNDNSIIKGPTTSIVKAGDTYTTYPLANNEIPKGYKLEKTTGDATKGTTGAYNINVTYVYSPDAPTEVSDSKTVTETIHYVYADGKTAKPDYTASKTFTRKGEKDAVTGDVTWGDWTNTQTFDAVKSPDITGYTADKKEIPAKSVDANSKDIVETVTYTAVAVPEPIIPEKPVTPTPEPTVPQKPTTPEPTSPQKPVTSVPEPQPDIQKPITTIPESQTKPVVFEKNIESFKQTSTHDLGNTQPMFEKKAQIERKLPQTSEDNSTKIEISVLGLVGIVLGLFGLSDRKRKN